MERSEKVELEDAFGRYSEEVEWKGGGRVRRYS